MVNVIGSNGRYVHNNKKPKTNVWGGILGEADIQQNMQDYAPPLHGTNTLHLVKPMVESELMEIPENG